MVDVFSSKLASALLAGWTTVAPLQPAVLQSAAMLPDQAKTAFNNRAFGPKSTLPVVPLPSDEQLKDLERASYGGNVADIRAYQYALLRKNFPEFFVGDRAIFEIRVQGEPMDAASVTRTIQEAALLRGKKLPTNSALVGEEIAVFHANHGYATPRTKLTAGLAYNYRQASGDLEAAGIVWLNAQPNPDIAIKSNTTLQDPALCSQFEKGVELFYAIIQGYIAHHEIGHVLDYEKRGGAFSLDAYSTHVRENIANAHAFLMTLKALGPDALPVLNRAATSDDLPHYSSRTLRAVERWYETDNGQALARMTPREVFAQANTLVRPLPRDDFNAILEQADISETRKKLAAALQPVSQTVADFLYPPPLIDYQADKTTGEWLLQRAFIEELPPLSQPVQAGPPFHPLEKMRESLFCNQPMAPKPKNP